MPRKKKLQVPGLLKIRYIGKTTVTSAAVFGVRPRFVFHDSPLPSSIYHLSDGGACGRSVPGGWFAAAVRKAMTGGVVRTLLTSDEVGSGGHKLVILAAWSYSLSR